MPTEGHKPQVRGHHIERWKACVSHLRTRGEEPTFAKMAALMALAGKDNEVEFGHTDYTGGMEPGVVGFAFCVTLHVASVLNAAKDTLVLVNGERDGTCEGCLFKGPRHCDKAGGEDNDLTELMIRRATETGYVDRSGYRRHSSDPNKIMLAAYIPAGIIQEYVFGQ